MIHVLTGHYGVWPLPPAPRELDLGCGKGGFLLALAARYPNRQVIGADVMLGRLRRIQRKAERRALANLSLLRANGLDLAAHLLPDASLQRIHLLHPDPWPKARHATRRLVCSEYLARLGNKLLPGGVLHLSTDDPAYAERMHLAIDRLDGFTEDLAGIADVRDLQTDFEREFAAKGFRACHFSYRRRS